MNWLLERDENGEPARLIWAGPEEETFGALLEAELSRCVECGFPCGWHKLGCSKKGAHAVSAPQPE